MYFAGVNTIEELRKHYRELLKKHHPDNGGDLATMQEINAEYDRLFSVLSRSENTDKKTYTKEEDEQFRAILNAVSAYNMDIQIIGSWIWCFNSYPYREWLKSLGFAFAPKKKAWTWHSEPYHRHHKGEVPLSHIREKYGCETVRNMSYQYSLD